MLYKLIDFAAKFWDQVKEVVSWIYESIFSLISNLFYFIFDSFLSVFETIFNSINFAEITALTTLQSWTGLPDQVIWLLNYINLSICLGFVLTAYSIRLLINLIPASFTRV